MPLPKLTSGIYTAKQCFEGETAAVTQNSNNGNNSSITSPSVNPSGGQPSVTNSSTVDNAVYGYTDTAIDQYGQSHERADDRAKALEQEQHNTPGTYLNEDQNADYARGGGRWGRANNRTYNQTLQLSREADAYNNRPAPSYTHATRVVGNGPTAANSYMDASLARPNIETEEMREMQKSRQLDLNQKQLAQQLQAAVYRKDYDAFIQLFQQRYNMNLTRYQADLAMQTFANQNLAQQVVFKDRTIFNILAEFWNLGLKAKAIWDISQRDPGLAAIYCTLAVGQNVFGPEDIGMYQYAKKLMDEGYGIAEACQIAYQYYQNTLGRAATDNATSNYNYEKRRKVK